MITREYEGKTHEEALARALEDLKRSEDEVEVEYLNEEEVKAGFFGFRRNKPVRIRVSYSDQESDVCQRARAFLENVFQKMDVEATLTALETEDKGIPCVIIRVATEESAILIGRHGKTLESLQFLSNIVANRERSSGDWVRVSLDVEGYRDRHSGYIERMARQASAKAFRERRAVMLPPMPPGERRGIYLSLEGNDRVTARSEGEEEGTLKRVCIRPVGDDIDPDTIEVVEFQSLPPSRPHGRSGPPPHRRSEGFQQDRNASRPRNSHNRSSNRWHNSSDSPPFRDFDGGDEASPRNPYPSPSRHGRGWGDDKPGNQGQQRSSDRDDYRRGRDDSRDDQPPRRQHDSRDDQPPRRQHDSRDDQPPRRQHDDRSFGSSGGSQNTNRPHRGNYNRPRYDRPGTNPSQRNSPRTGRYADDPHVESVALEQHNFAVGRKNTDDS